LEGRGVLSRGPKRKSLRAIKANHITIGTRDTSEKITLSQYLKEVYELMEESANDVLDKKKEEIKKTAGLEITTKLLTGHISNAIIDFAAKEKVDLIVIGNVGRSGISKIRTLGSVSRSVGERAPCPVMIIH
jgi:nucleotide-binding universal stress UspA family protein